ncbi:MAG: preprotein translocase subunit YajC [Phycisphaerales bacterium]|nr:preprotein translocase subunit YajC [Phycisphaerales bacterium]
MLHHAWLSYSITPQVIAQPGAGAVEAPATATIPPSAGASNGAAVNVVGLPTGTQPAPPAGAQPGTTAVPGTALPPPAPARGADYTLLWMMGGMMVLVFGMQIFAGRGEKKRRAKMLAALGKGDKVMMMGGVIGTITEISDTEVVVRVEEGKIRYSRASIQQVLDAQAKAAA